MTTKTEKIEALEAKLREALAEMRQCEQDLRRDGMNAHANTYEHCSALVSAALGGNDGK